MALLLAAQPILAASTAIVIEPGRSVTAEEARGPAFLRDDQGRLVIIDYVQGFVLGRFATPSGAAPFAGSADGIALEEPGGAALPSISDPQTAWPLAPGFPLTLGGPIAGSPCLADLDRDGRTEIVAATLAGELYVISAGGALRPGWPQTADDEFFAPPAAGDLDGDGDLEIVIGGTSGWIYAWHGDGTPVTGWPLAPHGRPSTGREARGSTGLAVGIFAAAALGDLDGDGRDDVCLAMADGVVRVLHGDGRAFAGWPRRVEATTLPPASAVFGAPALVDLDGDGGPEILVATNAQQLCAWHASGEKLRGWPVTVPRRARAGYGGVAAGDIDGDGHPEVVVATEHGLDGPAVAAAFNREGRLLPSWPCGLPESAYAGAALGDLNGDGAADVVVATIGGHAAVTALNGSDGQPLAGWPVRLKNETIQASPVLADLDGDGRTDVLVAALSTEAERQTWLWALDPDGRVLAGFPILLPNDEIVRAAPGVADLDGDGDTELVVATELRGALHAWSLEVPYVTRLAPWPSTAGGPRRSGQPQTERAAGQDTTSGGFASGSGWPTPGVEHLATIAFELQRETDVRLAIFSVRGQRIRDLLDHCLPPGEYAIRWDGRDHGGKPLPSGIYFYQLDLEGRATTKQLLLLQ